MTSAVFTELERIATAPGVSTGPISAYPCTDVGNAELFRDLHGDRVRWDAVRGRWLAYGEHYWVTYDDSEIRVLAIQAARYRAHAAIDSLDSRERTEHENWARQSEHIARLNAAMEIAKGLPPIADRGEWDADPWLLGCENGVIELQTGTLRPGKPEDRITRSTGIEYRPEVRSPLWEQAVLDVCNGDVELARHWKRGLGYSITGDLREQKLFIAHGHGSNGKSTMFNAVRNTLGAYGGNASFSLIERQKRKGGTATPDLVNLEGKRLVTIAEVQKGAQLDEGRVKALTGGDPMQIRGLYEEERTVKLQAHFWVFLNHLPKVEDLSHGLWRRMNLVPFTRQFGEGDSIPDLEARLCAERVGILTWLVEGCLEWQEHGLAAPETVRNAVAQYRESSDPYAEFLRDYVEEADVEPLPAKELYRAWQRYEADTGVDYAEQVKEQTFSKAMAERFQRVRITSGEHKGKYGYRGIRLRVDEGDGPRARHYDDIGDGSHLF